MIISLPRQIRTYSLIQKKTISKRVNCSKSLIQQEHKWVLCMEILFIYHGATASGRPGPPHYRTFTITFRYTTCGRTPLGGWSARRQDLHLTIHNTQKTKTSMPPTGFEPAIPASERRTPSTPGLLESAVVYGEFALLLSTVLTKIGWDTLNRVLWYLKFVGMCIVLLSCYPSYT
jgi:hypothetical protein